MEGTVEALQNEHVGDEDRNEEDGETISVVLSLVRSINESIQFLDGIGLLHWAQATGRSQSWHLKSSRFPLK